MAERSGSKRGHADDRLRAQVDAEVAFGTALESPGMDYESLIGTLHVSTHDLNTMAHYLGGVNDEQPPAALVDAIVSAGLLMSPLQVAM